MNKKEIDKIKQDCLDPVILKKVIDTILDPKNPDSESIKKEIVKNISLSIKKDTAFLTTIKGMCIERAEEVTTNIVHKSIEDSKDQLTNALVTTINIECQEYFNNQKQKVVDIIKKTLNKCVDDIISETKKIINTNKERLNNQNVDRTSDNNPTVSVPLEYKKQVEDYIGFLKSKK